MSNRVISSSRVYQLNRVKSYSETNLGYQGMVKTIKEWLSNRVLAAKQYAVLKIGQYVVFIKLGQNMHQMRD